MNKKNIIYAVSGILLILIVGTYLIAGKRTNKMPSTTAPDSEQESLLSSSASEMLKHIDMAKRNIRSNDLASANHELGAALNLLTILEKNNPGKTVNGYFHDASKRISNHDTIGLRSNLIAISNSLNEIASYTPITEVQEQLKAAEHMLQNGEDSSAIQAIGKARAAFIYDDHDMPLNFTRTHLRHVMAMLTDKDTTGTYPELSQVESAISFVSIGYFSPLSNAKLYYWNAEKDLNNGNLNKAGQALAEASTELARFTGTTDPVIRKETTVLQEKISSLRDKVIRGSVVQ